MRALSETVGIQSHLSDRDSRAGSERLGGPLDSFGLAQLYYAACQIDQAERAFVTAAAEAHSNGNIDLRTQCLTKLLRIYTERQDNERVSSTITELSQLGLDETTRSSSILYALGLCATYQRRYIDAALNFKSALETALSNNNQYDMAHALYGMIAVFWVEGRHEKALHELKSLRVVTEAVGASELELTSYITEALILLDLARAEEAIAVLTSARERILGFRNWYMHLFLMYTLAKAYASRGQFDRARLYGELAGASADPKNFKNLSSQIAVLLSSLRAEREPPCEVFFDSASNLVVIENQKRVDLKNQFILLKLLRVFTAEPGRVFSKQDLIEDVWAESYDPLVHDNKIYVTIRRLRKLLEPDFEKPKYILRSGGGYVFNPATHLVRVADSETVTTLSKSQFQEEATT